MWASSPECVSSKADGLEYLWRLARGPEGFPQGPEITRRKPHDSILGLKCMIAPAGVGSPLPDADT